MAATELSLSTGGVDNANGQAARSTEPRPHLPTLIAQILDPAQRKEALSLLCKNREHYDDLAPTIWFSTGIVAALLQEVISMYPFLAASSPPATVNSDNVCNALALFQSVAQHPQTRTLFLHAQIPMYLYPFLNTQQKSRAYEYLRLTSLGVIGALVKSDDLEVVKFLLHTEIIPLCLRIMENSNELPRTVATFIVQKIILSDLGIQYVCATAERFYAVSRVLQTIVRTQPSARLLKHVVRCYLRLVDHERARAAMKGVLPEQLRDGTFRAHFAEDATMEGWLQQLLKTIDLPMLEPGSSSPAGGPGGPSQ